MNLLAVKEDPVIYAIPLFLVCIIIELFLNFREQRNLYVARDSFASIAMGVGSLIIDIGVKTFYLLIYTLIYNHYHLFDLGYGHWYSWVLLLDRKSVV